MRQGCVKGSSRAGLPVPDLENIDIHHTICTTHVTVKWSFWSKHGSVACSFYTAQRRKLPLRGNSSKATVSREPPPVHLSAVEIACRQPVSLAICARTDTARTTYCYNTALDDAESTWEAYLRWKSRGFPSEARAWPSVFACTKGEKTIFHL